MNLDIRQTLSRYGIPYAEDHKNVTEKCVGISPCPECGDTEYHCGIFLETGRYTCWKCKISGSFYKLLKIMANVSYREYKTLVKGAGYKRGTVEQLMDIYMEKPGVEKERILYGNVDDFPGERITNRYDSPLLNKFLEKRNIDIRYSISTNCRITDGIGEYPHKLIIPILDKKGKYVGWQGRDLTGKAKIPYVNPSHFPIHEYLYDLWVSNNCLYLIVCEGVFDAWRLYDKCMNMSWKYEPIASLGNSLSREQKIKLYNHIKENKIEGIIFAWDADSHYKARKEAKWFSLYCKAKAIRFPEGEDPDSFGGEETLRLIEDTPWL